MGFLGNGGNRNGGPKKPTGLPSGPQLPSIHGSTPPAVKASKSGGSAICPHCGKDTNEAPQRASPDQVRHMLDELDRAEGCTVWEDKFCVDMQSSLEKYGSLTPRQFATLQKIYDERVK